MGGAASAVGSAIGGGQISNGLTGVFGGGGGAGSIGGFLGGIGSGLSAANPFHAANWTQMNAPAGPTTVNGPTGMPAKAPTMASAGKASAATMSAPSSITGAQLQGVGDQNAFRQSQLNTINGLQGVANGSVNPAQTLMTQNMAQNTAQQFAMANSARGGAGASAMRQAMNNAQVNNAQAASQGAQMGLQNQMNAAGLVGNLAGQGYGQDINVANANAGNTMQASLANQQSQLATNQMNAQNAQQANMATFQGNLQTNQTNAQLQNNYNQLAAQYQQMGMSAQEANQKANLEYQNQLMQQQSFNTNTSLGVQGAQKQAIGGFMSGIGSAIPIVGGMFKNSGGSSLGPTGGGDDLGSGMDLGLAHGGLVIPPHVLLGRLTGSY